MGGVPTIRPIHDFHMVTPTFEQSRRFLRPIGELHATHEDLIVNSSIIAKAQAAVALKVIEC